MEAQTYQRIQEKIQERVMNNLGTWIDWQYLHNAAKLLAKVLWLHACMGSELQRWKCRNGETDAHRGKKISTVIYLFISFGLNHSYN